MVKALRDSPVAALELYDGHRRARVERDIVVSGRLTASLPPEF